MRSAWNPGYTRISERMIFVWDAARFRIHVGKRRDPTELDDWVVTFDPPALVYNGYLWVYSPGPIPRQESYT